MTDRYAVIGNPVGHSKSPWIHGEFARATGQDIEYLRIEAPLDGFARALDEFRKAHGKGANVTLPFKEAAYRYCDEVTADARRAGAVNTLAFASSAGTRGDNTDGRGLLRDLTANLAFPLHGQVVLLLGAGGAARGVLGPLIDAGPARIVIANRTPGKALELARRFPAARVEGCGFSELDGRDFDLVINATSAGLDNATPPVPTCIFRKRALAYELVYGRDTPFLALARRCGAMASDGTGMLVEQAADSFCFWRGVRPQTAAVIAALRAG
jgi:shikimate dehydrogenase